MKFFDLAAATRGETSLVRAAAGTFIGATVIVALYFGREVLIPVAIAVLFAFILDPAVTWVRRLLPLPFGVAAVVLGALVVAGLLAMLVTTRSGHALRGRLGRTHRGWRGRGGRVNAVDS